MLASTLLFLLARLLHIIILPTSFFLPLIRPTPLSVHKQITYQNVRLDQTRVASIQFPRILIFPDVAIKYSIRNEWDEVKKLANLNLNFCPTMCCFWTVTLEWWWVILEKFRDFNDCVWQNFHAAKWRGPTDRVVGTQKNSQKCSLYMMIPAINYTQKQWYFPEL